MNHKSLTGREVISINSGRKLGQIDRILFDPSTMRIAAVVVRPVIHSVLAEPGPMQQVGVNDIRGLGEDVVTVQSDDALQPVAEDAIDGELVAFDQIENEAVVTKGGKKIGEVDDVEFDDHSMRLESIQLSRGFLARKFSIPVSTIVSVGEDVIVVHDSADPEADSQAETPQAVEAFDRVRVISDAERHEEPGEDTSGRQASQPV